MVALGGVFAALPEDVLKNLTMDLQLVSAPLKQEKYADTWTMLYMYKKNESTLLCPVCCSSSEASD